MKYFILFLFINIGCSASEMLSPAQGSATTRSVIKNHPCDTMPNRFKMKNLNDLDALSKFNRMNEIYPWMRYSCNGVICTREQFEAMCYIIRRELKNNRDPNLTIPQIVELLEQKMKPHSRSAEKNEEI